MNIVTIGGGTGAPVVIKALLTAGYNNISAICAAMDSGGKTGVIRSDERDRVIAISDLLRNLLALIPPDGNHLSHINAFVDLAGFIDGRNRNLGYMIYYALLEKFDSDFTQVQKHLEKLLGIHFLGTAIPVSLQPTTICFTTQSGDIFRGEHELDRQAMSANMITKIWLEPEVVATPEAIQTINAASHIIFCPGSLYGSVLVNLLPTGIRQALRKSQACKILIANLVSNRNQTHQFNVCKYLKVFQSYGQNDHPLDIIITPHLTRLQFEKKYPKITQNYAREHAHFIGTGKCRGVKVLPADILAITPQLGRLRHDPDKLAGVLKNVIDTTIIS